MARDGVPLISAGLDHWFEDREGHQINQTNLDEFRISEWRLERLLSVNHFLMPADFRRVPQYTNRDEVPNAYIYHPFLRFPTWYVCSICRYLIKRPLTIQGYVQCGHEFSNVHRGKEPAPMHQVPYVAICPDGHIQDFPWNEWVHKSANPACSQPMRLESKPGVGPGSEVIRCNLSLIHI